ncbi:alpha/beta-hydrolase [Vararia minispora EC-137]|uniref:Alpha/beta-hydrolase n=1 Tax=Vararia minispora EC-137 TaxID=1314806 RepID=A0ACB8QDS5_9AGAM|nr:alpha/beta-hydrolase [Vararia minispora EC-137]
MCAESEYRVEDHDVTVEGGTIPVRVTIPPYQQEDETFPLLVYYHGGGFFAGDIGMRDYQMRYLSCKLRIVTVNVGYRRLSTEPAPIPQNDSYLALKWAYTNSSSLSADTTKGFVAMGQSAGGQLAAVASQRAAAEGMPLTGQVLQIPATCHPDAVPDKWKDRLLSRDQNKDAPALPRIACEHSARFLGGTPTDLSISPLLAPSQILSKLPRTHVQVCGLDPLRDEGILYEKLLKDAGVETRLDIYPGVPHSFEDFAPEISLAKKLIADLERGIKWVVLGA